MRADARRNYEQLLAQARSAFAEFGVDASLDEIARRAGVASGTLYRHFPTRLDLVEAVLAEQIAELVARSRGQLGAEAAFDALAAWLRASLAHGMTYRGLAAAALTSGLDGPLAAWHAELLDVGSALLEQARRSGEVVAEVDAADVLRMVGAIAWAVQDVTDGADGAERLLTLLLNGLRSDL